MNLKGNTFSLGSGQPVSAVKKDGTCHIFLRRSGPIAYMQFNPATRALIAVNAFVSYGDYCRLANGSLAEYADGKLNYIDI